MGSVPILLCSCSVSVYLALSSLKLNGMGCNHRAGWKTECITPRHQVYTVYNSRDRWIAVLFAPLLDSRSLCRIYSDRIINRYSFRFDMKCLWLRSISAVLKWWERERETTKTMRCHYFAVKFFGKYKWPDNSKLEFSTMMGIDYNRKMMRVYLNESWL